MSTQQYETLSAPEVLQTKIRIWRKRLQYAQEIRNHKQITACEQAVADLTARLAAHECPTCGDVRASCNAWECPA